MIDKGVADTLRRRIARQVRRKGNELHVLQHPDEVMQKLLERLQVQSYGGTVYTLPWLSENACKGLLELYDREEYEVNEAEPVDAQIPEYVISQLDPEVSGYLKEALLTQLHPVIMACIGQGIREIASIQLAVYEADGEVPRGTLHTDEDSDITITVALNEDYEGGGLHVYTGGVLGQCYKVPKLAAGTASIFRGRACVHAGQPVTDGDRHLLVFWCRT